MTEAALIRYICVTDAAKDPEQIAFPYLEAIDQARLGARVMPLGAFHFAVEPWNRLSHLFLSALRPRFVNVVCVPPGLPIVGQGPGQDGKTAIDGLYTVGIPNIAITSGLGDYSEKELAVLRLYNEVITPDEEGRVVLASKEIDAHVVPPEPEALSALFSGMTLP